MQIKNNPSKNDKTAIFAIKEIEKYKLTKEDYEIIAYLILISLYNTLCSSEAKKMTILSHPGIVNYFETIETHSHLYIVLEYVEGIDLFDLVEENGFLEGNLNDFSN